MNQSGRLAFLFSFVVISIAVAWDFTPRTSGRNSQKGKVESSRLAKKARSGNIKTHAAESPNNNLSTSLFAPIPEPTVVPVDPEGEEDPDLPPGMAGKIDKEAYLRARGDYFDMLRGRDQAVPEGAREKAIQKMDTQERLMRRTRSSSVVSLVNTTDWVFIGPNPIPQGQTQGARVPVSGRTISIAVHPTDPDTVYVGTAQGGLYKSTNGGTNWTRLFDFQLESLAIGAITIDPTDSSIVYVGTGENGQSADSYAGRGLYIIRNANSATPTLTGPFRLDGAAHGVVTGRAFGRIMVSSTNNNVVYVCTTSGTGGNPNTSPTTLPLRGLYRS